jgi:hypothetical protein
MTLLMCPLILERMHRGSRPSSELARIHRYDLHSVGLTKDPTKKKIKKKKQDKSVKQMLQCIVMANMHFYPKTLICYLKRNIIVVV